MLANNYSLPPTLARWIRTPQELRLAIALGLVLLGAAGYRMWIASQTLWSAQHSRIAQLQESIDALHDELTQNEHAAQVNKQRQRLSLPSDSTLAATRYYAWLHDLTTRHGWTEVKIDNTAPASERAIGDRIVHSIQARATIEAIGTWLEEFQEFPLLHNLTHLQIVDYSPLSHEARVQLSIETLSLSDAPSDMQLQVGRQATPTEGRLATNLKNNNPFRRYEPPRPVAVTPKTVIPQVDHLSKVKFVGIVQRGGQQQAWFYDSLARNEILVSTGSPLEVDTFSGNLERVDQAEAVFNGPRGTFTMRLGQDLREVVGPEPEPETKSNEDANQNLSAEDILPTSQNEALEESSKVERSTSDAAIFRANPNKPVSHREAKPVFSASGQVN